MEEAGTQHEANPSRMEAVRAHSVAELLECPAAIGHLLNNSVKFLNFDAGEIVFRQAGICHGLYLVLSGRFQRRTERLEVHLMLGPVRTGDMVELAAALGDNRHTYTLAAQSAGSLLMLPIDALNQAFQNYPPLRMRLLEELAREVSRAYITCCLGRAVRSRHENPAARLA